MSATQFPQVSRRRTLQWMAATSLAAGLPHWSSAGVDSPIVGPLGYGTDPDLMNPVVPWLPIMSPRQLKETALLADLVLPGMGNAPAPSAIGVPDFVNEWVSAPYPAQLRDRRIVFEGLAWLDSESAQRGQTSFIESAEEIRRRIVDDIASPNPTSQLGEQKTFFERFRFLVVGAYYTTPEGWGDIGYIGNVPLPAYPPVTDEERAILDKALSKLGLI